jgi:predicted ABC-type ATPase
LVGYERHVFYLWLPSPEMAVARVKGRVKAGGHHVPEHVIRRRFGKSLVNFYQLYRPNVTTWRLYDGSSLAGRPLVAHGAGRQKAVVVDEERWALVARQIQEADR